MNKKLLGLILFITVLAMSINIGIAADKPVEIQVGINAVASGAAVDYPAEGGSIKINTATGTVIGYSGAVTKADIPAVLNGAPVKAVGSNAFMNCKSLARITFPQSVAAIAADSFAGCDKTKLVFGVIKGSAAESYAVANGFKTEYVEAVTETTTLQHPVRYYGAKRYRWKNVTSSTTEETTEETTDEQYEASEDEEEKTLSGDVRVTIGSSIITVGNEEFVVDAAPYIQAESNSTLVPLRFAAVAISGGNVEKAQDSSMITWYADTKTAAIDTGDRTVSFTAGSDKMDIDGISYDMDNGVKAEITGGRMFIPMRALGEALDVNVYWDAENRTALYSEK